MRITFSFAAQGELFKPSTAERESNFTFDEKNEPGDIADAGRYINQPQPYGCGMLLREVTPDEMESCLNSLLVDIRRCMPWWRKNGAEEFSLRLDVYYREQCNIEVSQATSALLSELHLSLAISCYKEDD